MVLTCVGDGEAGSVSMEVVLIGEFVPLRQSLIVNLAVTIQLSLILLTRLIWLHNNFDQLSFFEYVLLHIVMMLIG